MSGFKIVITVFIAILLVFAFSYRKQAQVPGGQVFTGLMASERVTTHAMNAEVTGPENNTLGMAAEGYLNFGRIPSGSDVRKTLVLNNDEQSPVKIKLSSEGNITPFVSFSDNNFLLNSGREIGVTFSSADVGNFSGTLTISAIKPRNWLTGWLLQWM